MLNTSLFAEMKKKGAYDLPTLIGYKGSGQVTKWLGNSGLDLSSLKPYNKLSETELRRIIEKAEVPNSKAQEMEELLALLDGKEVVAETVVTSTSTGAKKTPVKKQSCGESCTCGTTDKDKEIAKLRKEIKQLKLDKASLEIVAKVVNKEDYLQLKAELEKEEPNVEKLLGVENLEQKENV